MNYFVDCSLFILCYCVVLFSHFPLFRCPLFVCLFCFYYIVFFLFCLFSTVHVKGNQYVLLFPGILAKS